LRGEVPTLSIVIHISAWGLLFFSKQKTIKMKNFIKKNKLQICSRVEKPSKLFDTRFSVTIGGIVYFSYKSTDNDKSDGFKWLNSTLVKAEKIQEQIFLKTYNTRFKLVSEFIIVSYLKFKTFLRFNETEVL
jgi:hypothetical protein